MTEDELRLMIVEEIGNIAPEVNAEKVPDKADLREALDLDSMDIFNLVVALSHRLAIDIPDGDAPRLVTLAGGVSYLRERLAGPSPKA